jgi:hypothetical protein
MEATGNGKSSTGVADRTRKMAIGNNTANAITTTMALRTAHCSSGSETRAEEEGNRRQFLVTERNRRLAFCCL